MGGNSSQHNRAFQSLIYKTGVFGQVKAFLVAAATKVGCVTRAANGKKKK